MGLIITNPGGALTTGPASGQKVYAYNTISTTPQVVVPQNVARQSVTFHNPGTVDIFIAPSSAYTTPGGATPATLTPNTSALGGCFRVFANGGSLTITGECQLNWQAFSASGSGNPLTVMDSNI